MRIALVMGNHKKHGFPPLGVLYLAAYLRKYNPECGIKVYDVFPPEELLLQGGFDLIEDLGLLGRYRMEMIA